MAAVVFILSFLTSLACAILLLRGFRRSGARLLLWSGLCFIGMSLHSLALLADRVLFPDVDLFLLRNILLVAGLCLMLYGLIWEAE